MGWPGKDEVVASIRDSSYRVVAGSGDLDLIEGHSRFVGPRRLEVDGGDTIEAGRVFLNTGTRDTIPPIAGLDRIGYLTSRSILELRELPDHLVVVGGGFVGCELAQMFARFGARVTVVHRAGRLLPAEDPAVSQAVAAAFGAEGIEVLTATSCVAVEPADGGIRVQCEGDETGALWAAICWSLPGGPQHRRARARPARRHARWPRPLAVDDQLRTEVVDVWALGDLRGSDMFTHTARDDAEVVYRTVFRGQDRSIEGRVVAHAVLVDPEVASVGLTEQQARDAGHDVAIGSQDFAGVAKARAIGDTDGFIKLVADAATDRLLGCHIVGPDAGNLVHEAVPAMAAGVSFRDIGRAIHIHPTLAEGISAAAGGVHRPSME